MQIVNRSDPGISHCAFDGAGCLRYLSVAANFLRQKITREGDSKRETFASGTMRVDCRTSCEYRVVGGQHAFRPT